MKGHRRVRRANDSLDLLLDTICNAFGGIVLIALLISLVTQQIKIEEADHASDVENQILEREIARYSAQIRAAQAFLKDQDKNTSLAESVPEHDDGIREARDAIESAKKKMEATGYPPLDAAQAAQERRQIDAELAAAEVRGEALEDQKAALELRWTDLQKAIVESSQTLRLPKEQESRKGALWFILTQNEVFPRTVLVGGELDNNRGAFEGVWNSGEDELRPVPSKGLRPADVASEMGNLLRKMHEEDLYAAILLKEDSVPAFIALKEALVANGVSFGWKFHAGGIYAFTLEGGSRPPQL